MEETEKVADALWGLARDLDRARGGSPDTGKDAGRHIIADERLLGSQATCVVTPRMVGRRPHANGTKRLAQINPLKIIEMINSPMIIANTGMPYFQKANPRNVPINGVK